MKKLALLAVVAIAGFAVYHFTMDGGTPSGDDAVLVDLEQRFDSAKARFSGAERGAGLAGIDTTSDADAAMAEIDRVLTSVQELARRADDSVRPRAERLERTIRAFKSEHD